MNSCFDAVLGQVSAIEKLKILLRSQQIPPAMIFKGPSGCGKKKTAICFAAARLCEKSVEGCGVCPSCQRVISGQSESLILVEALNGVIKIEQAREVLSSLSLANWAGARFVIINDAHLMNPQASNALLKAIEEPPPHTHFIFITDNYQSLLSTIRSRCQSLLFESLSTSILRTLGAREDWMVKAARGSAEKLQVLQNSEMQDARTMANQILTGPAGVDFHVLDRESILLVLRFLQMDLVDLMAQEFKKHPAGGSADVNFANERYYSSVFQAALQSEKDILANCDAKLTMDVFLRGIRAGAEL